MKKLIKYNVLRIDAWANGEGGWMWNNAMRVGTVVLAEDELTTRRILKHLRDNGFLTNNSKGMIRVEEYGERDFELQDRRTGEPILALVEEIGRDDVFDFVYHVIAPIEKALGEAIEGETEEYLLSEIEKLKDYVAQSSKTIIDLASDLQLIDAKIKKSVKDLKKYIESEDKNYKG